jgi:hypothetical protein
VFGQLSHRIEHLGLPFIVSPTAAFAPRATASREAGHYCCRVERNGCNHAAARDAVALFEHDSTEPTGKRRRLSQLGERAIRLEERFLRRVFGELEVVEDRVAVANGHVLKAADENGERLGVAVLCPRHDHLERVHLPVKSHRRDEKLLGAATKS